MLNPKQARNELNDILGRREYRIYYNHSKSWLETWWEHAKEWIAKKLENLFPTIDASSGAALPVLIGVITLVVILLALTIFYVVRTIRRNRIFRNQNPLQSMKELDWSYLQHISEAKKQEELGEYSRSTRHLFLAVLLYFHKMGLLEARIWKTNWDYYEELRKINRLSADQFYNLAALFDEVTYGSRMVSKDEFLPFRESAMKWLEDREKAQKGGFEIHEQSK